MKAYQDSPIWLESGCISRISKVWFYLPSGETVSAGAGSATGFAADRAILLRATAHESSWLLYILCRYGCVSANAVGSQAEEGA